MPPNRKTSSTLSDDFLLSSRLRLANPHLQPTTTVTAKDAVVVKPVDDVESYWNWPTAASLPPAPSQASDDDETARRNNQKKKKKAIVVVDLFSAHHIVANLIREVSHQEEKPQQQQRRPEHPPREHVDDDGPAVSSTTTATAPTTTIDNNDLQRTYWDWTQPVTTIDPAHIDDRWTSGLAMERNLVRDAATAASSTETMTTTLVADHDAAWDWVTFPRRAAERQFSHDHYERHLVQRASSCGSNTSSMPVVVVPLVDHHHDDYWHGL
jgi:hypothetical protein